MIFRLPIKSVLLLVIAFGLFSFFYINPGYYERIYASFYNKYSKFCDHCDAEGHGVRYCPVKAVESGALGRWVIPDVGVNVACYTATEKAQDITDAKDSAALIHKPDTTLLADHNYQGFSAIKKCTVGAVAYMDTGREAKQYVCTEVLEGYNVGSHLTDLEGNIVEFENGYTNYTCHFFSDRITIVHFEPV